MVFAEHFYKRRIYLLAAVENKQLGDENMKIYFIVTMIISFSITVFAQDKVEIFGGFSRQQIETEQFREFSRYAGLTPAQVQTNTGATQTQLAEGFKDTYRAARNLNGINVAVTYYFKGGLGVTGDFAYHFKEEDRNTRNNPLFFEDFTRSRRRALSLIGGPQYKFNKNSKIQPFVRALFGVTRQKNRSSQFFDNADNTNPGGTNTAFETTRLEDNYTGFIASGGGGLDVKISKNFAIRVIQFDYLATFTSSRDARLTALGINGNASVSLGQTSFESSRRDNFRFSFGIVFQK